MFALPTVVSTIFMNIYTSVDGIFVARFIDTDALSAINITLPMTYLVTAVGTMFGTGGNALVSKKIGEGKYQEAKENFSLMIVVAFFSKEQVIGDKKCSRSERIKFRHRDGIDKCLYHLCAL